MAPTAEEFKELALLARESGDDALEMRALEGFNSVIASGQPQASETQEQPFDLESFQPGGEIGPGQAKSEPSRQTPVNLGLEAITGFQRGLAGLVDFVGPDTIDAISKLVGSDIRSPRAINLVEPKGAFAGDGLGTDIAAGAGEFASLGAGAGGVLRGAASLLPKVAKAESALIGTARQLGKSTAGQDIAFGSTSGAGAATGQELGGTEGAFVGALVGPAAAITALGGAKAVIGSLAPKLGRNINLIDQGTGLPTPVLEKALEKRGLDYGSIIDDVPGLPVVSGRRSAEQVVDQIVRRKIKSGAKDNALAALRLEQNNIVADELGEEAVRQGYRLGDVAAAKGASNPTKKEMNKMLIMQRRITSDTSKSQEFRPTDVAGDHVLSKFDFIRGKADTLRNDLDKIANKHSGAGKNLLEGPSTVRGLRGLEINTGAVEDNLINQMKKLGIALPEESVNIASALKGKGAFVGSDISKDRTSQRIIKDVVDLLSEPGSDAFRAHKLKKQLDTMIDFNKKSSQGLTEAGRDFAKGVRFSLNEAIRDVHPQYAHVNDELSLSIGTMNNFQRVLGGSIDVFAPGANKAIGQDLRGLLSNRKTRIKLDNSINEIDSTVKKLGGDFNVSVKDLSQFANTLDDMFGAVARTSLKGENESVARKAVRGTSGVVDLIVQKAAQKAEKLRGINDKNAFDSMQKLLKRKESR